MAGEETKRRPLIGITVDVEEEYLRLRRHYPVAISEAGAVPVLVSHSSDPSSVAEIIDGLLIPGGGDIDPSYYLKEAQRCCCRIHAGTVQSGKKDRFDTTRYEIVRRERTDFEIDLLEAIMELRKPVLGVCYGMQLINVALGGGLYQDLVSEFDTAIDHTRGNHRILGEGSLIEGEFTVNSSHHQGVKQLGRGLLAVACSDDSLVEAIQLRDYPFFMGVQWHPERDGGDMSRKLFRTFVEKAHD
jgi:putative glutamine amidotransferase